MKVFLELRFPPPLEIVAWGESSNPSLHTVPSFVYLVICTFVL